MRKAAAEAPPSDYKDFCACRKTLLVADDIRAELASKAGKNWEDLAVSRKILDDHADDGEYERAVPFLRCSCRKDEGNALFAAGKYEEAIGLYLKAIRAHVGDEFELPTKVYYNEMYRSVVDSGNSYLGVVDLTACATNIAQCYIKLNNCSKV